VIHSYIIGKPSEVVASMMTFGLSADDFPVSEDGSLKYENHLAWIAKRQKIGSAKSSSGQEQIVKSPSDVLIFSPLQIDVLLGRGRGTMKHPGNLRLRMVMQSFFVLYENSTKMEKPFVAKLVVEEVQKKGGRFMKKEGVGWQEVVDEIAGEKVKHGFRDLRLRKSKAIIAESIVKHGGGTT
jgi:hypothetical protein